MCKHTLTVYAKNVESKANLDYFSRIIIIGVNFSAVGLRRIYVT